MSEHREAPVFRVPQCVCGHLEGDHLSNGTSFPHPLRFGLCRVESCDCQEFQDVNPDRKQAS